MLFWHLQLLWLFPLQTIRWFPDYIKAGSIEFMAESLKESLGLVPSWGSEGKTNLHVSPSFWGLLVSLNLQVHSLDLCLRVHITCYPTVSLCLCHKFWYAVLSFSFGSKYFKIFTYLKYLSDTFLQLNSIFFFVMVLLLAFLCYIWCIFSVFFLLL